MILGPRQAGQKIFFVAIRFCTKSDFSYSKLERGDESIELQPKFIAGIFYIRVVIKANLY